MSIIKQVAINKPSVTYQPVAIDESLVTQRKRLTVKSKQLLPMLVSGVFLGTFSLSATASTLINSTDYLNYELPKSIQERCIERDNCPEIDIKYIKTNQSWINNIVNAHINQVAVNIAQTESALIAPPITTAQVKKSLDNFARASFIDSPEGSTWGYSLTINPEYIGHVQDFELFEISSYVFTGGAHGMPYSEYFIFDPSTKKQVQLDDMLQVGKKPRFKALAYEAYKTWVKTVDEDVRTYEKGWPFMLNDNITLTDKGIDILYQPYAIGPYAIGMPVLSIPYSKLRGIIKPHFIPK